MNFERTYEDLRVVLLRDREGRIVKADLRQPVPPDTEDMLQLNPFQLYGLVDAVALADPEEFSRRFPQAHVAELALRRVADYFQNRAEVNRWAATRQKGKDDEVEGYFLDVANTFDLAVTTIMEEIEGLYAGEVDPTQAVNDNLNRRS